MGLKFNIKKSIMLASIKKKNKDHPFDLERYETHQLPKAANRFDINSFYFSAHSLDGQSLLLRKAVRGEGFSEIWFVYHTKDATYVNKKTTYHNEKVPLEVHLIEIGKKWQFVFKGKLTKMKIDETKVATYSDEEVEVEASGEFISDSPIFDFTSHLDPELLAQALAKEKWDKRFKHDIKLNQQVHVEQQGTMTASLKIGEETIDFSANAMRDHSFGRRDWDYMNRHIWLMAIIRKGESLNLNRVSYPHMKHLITGYYEKDGRVEQISADNHTTSIPTVGCTPERFKYHVELKNAIKFDVKAEVEVIIPFIFNEGKYILFEGIGTFDINRRKARGIMEFGFNEDETRWQINE